MSAHYPTISQKTFANDERSFEVAITAPRQTSGPTLPRNPAKRVLFRLGWLIGRLKRSLGAPVRLVNVWLISNVDNSSLPTTIREWSAARNILYVSQLVARWRDLEVDLRGRHELERGKSWLKANAIEPSHGVPRWILDNAAELSDLFSEDIRAWTGTLRRNDLSAVPEPSAGGMVHPANPSEKESVALATPSQESLAERPVEKPESATGSPLADADATPTESNEPQPAAADQPSLQNEPPVATRTDSAVIVAPVPEKAAETELILDNTLVDEESTELLPTIGALSIDAEPGEVPLELKELAVEEEEYGGPTESALPAGISAPARFSVRWHTARITATAHLERPLVEVLPPALRFMARFAEIALGKAETLGLMSSDRRWSIADLGEWDGVSRYLYRPMQAASFNWPQLKLWRGSVGNFNVTGHEAIGFAMLTHCALIGREHDEAGEIWPAVRESLGSAAQATWFQGEGPVRQHVRDVIRTACLRFGLRHAFDVESADQLGWFRTIQIQYGISAAWDHLSQHHRPAVATELLDSDGANYSGEFVALWDCVLRLQRHLVSERDFRHQLQTNPWIPSYGIEGLLGRLKPGSVDRQRGGDSSFANIFEEPELNWSGAEPFVRLALSDSLSARLAENEYVLKVGERAVPLKRSPNGAFGIATGPVFANHYLLDLRLPTVSVSIEHDETSVLCQEISLLPDNGLFSVYSLQSGKSQDVLIPRILKAGYLVICRRELTAQPDDAESPWKFVFNDQYKLMMISGALSAAFGIYFSDERLWPHSETVPVRQPSSVSAHCEGGYWGEVVSIILKNVPDTVESASLLFGGTEFPVVQDRSGRFVVRRFPLDPSLLYGVTNPRVRLRTWSNGSENRYDCLWVLREIRGALANVNGLWSALRPVTDRQFLRRAKMRLSPIEPEGYILVGNEICGLVREGHALLNDLPFSGWGEDVAYIRGLGVPCERLRLASSIFDGGLLTRVDKDCDDPERVRLILGREIKPNPDYSIWVWTQSAMPFRATICSHDLFEWSVMGLAAEHEPVAWAISYLGVRLGSRWASEHGFNALQGLIASRLDWAELSKWLRWFKAPVLFSDSLANEVRRRTDANPVESLSSWLLDDCDLADGVMFESRDRTGISLVREFLWDWAPEAEQAALALTALRILPSDYFRALSGASADLDIVLEASPVLLASIIFWGLGQLFYQADAKALVPICCKLRNQCSFGAVVGASDSILEGEWRAQQLKLLIDAGKDLGGVSTAFLERPLETAHRLMRRAEVTDKDREMLRLAASVESYRRWIAGQLINKFLNTLKK